MQHVHQIELGTLKLDTLSLQFVIQLLLLLLDVLRAVRHFLQHHLHHIHLADGQASHLGQRLLLHVSVAWRLQLG